MAKEELSTLQSSPFLRIGSRGSKLALVQAHLVRRLLAAQHGVVEDSIEIRTITTSGDVLTDTPLSLVGGKGLFSKEIEAALAANEIDLGVHSSKDMATTLPDGLVLAAFLKREDVRDAFVSLMKMLNPGVSRRLIFFFAHSTAATPVEIVILRAISSSSKSVIVLPSSTRVRRLVAPPVYKMLATREVLPECPCPTRATFRISRVS